MAAALQRHWGQHRLLLALVIIALSALLAWHAELGLRLVALALGARRPAIPPLPPSASGCGIRCSACNSTICASPWTRPRNAAIEAARAGQRGRGFAVLPGTDTVIFVQFVPLVVNGRHWGSLSAGLLPQALMQSS